MEGVLFVIAAIIGYFFVGLANAITGFFVQDYLRLKDEIFSRDVGTLTFMVFLWPLSWFFVGLYLVVMFMANYWKPICETVAKMIRVEVK